MNSVLISFIVMASIGLVLAILLYIASIYFKVEENEDVKKVRLILPGLNCGACGYPGCDGYATAIAENDAPLDKCLPGGEKVKNKLIALKNGESLSNEEIENQNTEENNDRKVAYVKCNGDCDKVTNKPECTGSCSELNKSTTTGCKYGCLGCGDCEKACNFDAIIIKDGLAFVYEDKCVACGACVKACPRNIIELLPVESRIRVACSNTDLGRDVNGVCSVGCIACHICEKQCNFDAIHVNDNLAKIDYSKCTQCEACVNKCPKHTIDNLKYVD